MNVVFARAYVGPTVFSHQRVVQMRVDSGPTREWTLARLGSAWLDALLEPFASVLNLAAANSANVAGDHHLIPAPDSPVGHLVPAIAIAVQRLASIRVCEGGVQATDAEGVDDLYFEYESRPSTQTLASFAVQFIREQLPPEAGQSPGTQQRMAPRQAIDRMLKALEGVSLDASVYELIRAARERGIPWRRVSDESRLVQLGHASQQHIVFESVTSQTSSNSRMIARDKFLTLQMLEQAGLPVAGASSVTTAQQAVAAAQQLGFPVVVKPRKSDKGVGVSVGLKTVSQVESAFAVARQYSTSVLAERFVPGNDHRILVVDGRVVAVGRRIPAHVVGDGVRSIAQLVELANQDPQRRVLAYGSTMVRLPLDETTLRYLQQSGFSPQTVPLPGQTVQLRGTANIGTGGSAIDLTDEIHPDNRRAAELAALTVNIDVAGVDFLTPDITRSWREVGGAICEVNPCPGLRTHLVAAAASGKPRDVGGPILDTMFPPGTDGRIPIAAVTGTNGKTTTCRMVAHILSSTGRRVGLATTDGVEIDGQRIRSGDCAGHGGARRVLSNRLVDAAVLETARGGIVKFGIGWDACDVGAVLNVTDDHIGQDSIESLDQLARAKRLVVELARRTAVLNADDERCLAMIPHLGEVRVCLTTEDPENAVIARHIEQGSPAAVLTSNERGTRIAFYDQRKRTDVVETRTIPATLEDCIVPNISNALHATAIACSLGVDPAEVGAALQTFQCNFESTPGRMSIYSQLPFRVVLDFAHNAPGMRVFTETIRRLAPNSRRILMFSSPGNRRDSQFHDLAATAAGNFDAYVCSNWYDLRGRPATDVPNALRDGLRTAGVSDDCISVCPDPDDAMTTAMQLARSNDWVAILGDRPERRWKLITSFES